MTTSTHLRTQLIPLAHHRLLLPNTAVAEVVPYSSHQAPPEDAPNWFLGMLNWRGQEIPLISLDILLGEPAPAIDKQTRCVVFNTLTSNQTLPFFTTLSRGIPHLLRLSEAELAASENEREHEFILSSVVVGEESALIPDLNKLEALISAILKD